LAHTSRSIDAAAADLERTPQSANFAMLATGGSLH
jgi:hypothetical protein